MLTKLKDILRLALDPEYMALSEASLIEYISDDQLDIEDEALVFELVEKWVGCIEKVLDHVRLPLCSADYLCDVVEKSPLLAPKRYHCQELLNEAKNYHMQPKKRHLMKSPRTRPRMTSLKLVVLGGGGKGEDKNRCCWWLNAKSNTWEEFTSLPGEHPWYAQFCIVNGDIIVSGGAETSIISFADQRSQSSSDMP